MTAAGPVSSDWWNWSAGTIRPDVPVPVSLMTLVGHVAIRIPHQARCVDRVAAVHRVRRVVRIAFPKRGGIMAGDDPLPAVQRPLDVLRIAAACVAWLVFTLAPCGVTAV